MESPIGCFDCHAIFPSDSPLDHFERLGLARSFRIDPVELEKRYLKWSREFHPDYFQLRPAEDQHLSMSLSAALNDAYKTLKDPFRRAEYLVHLAGGPSASQQRAMPEGFLEDVLDLRMAIEEAKEEPGGDPATLADLSQRVSADRASAMRRVEEAFDATPIAAGATPDPNALMEVRRQLNTVKYLDGLLRELDDLQQ
jgi:molecular chaperone HscB